MMSNFDHLNTESVVILFKSYCFLWYIFNENTTVMDLENAVHDGTNVLE